MSAADDRRFLAWFMRAVGVAAGFAAGTVLITSFVVSGAHSTASKGQPGDEPIGERLAPAARVAVAGQDNSALGAAAAGAAGAPAAGAASVAGAAPTPASPAGGAAATASSAVLPGEQVYNTTCVACHGAGIAGAPKFADKAAWAPRVAEGLAVLHKHALQGYQGKTGVMPPKGGRTDLADQSIENAVDYMANAAK